MQNGVVHTATEVACGWAGTVMNKAGYTATLVACGWAGAVTENITGAFGLEQ